MPPSAGLSSDHATTRHPHDPPSDAETEHLPFDDADADADADSDIVMHPSQLPPSAIHTGGDDMDDEPADSQGTALPSQSAMSSPQKAGGFTGDEFSDESDLTDDEDEQNNPGDNADDASSLSDDDLGGSEDEEQDEEEDEDDEDDDGAKDEAAEALAALTGGADTAGSSKATANDGLQGLAALAAAGAGDEDEEDEDEDAEEDDDEDEEDEDDDSEAEDGGRHRHGGKKRGRVQTLLQQTDDGFSSDVTPDPDDEDGEHRTADLDLIASMKKRAAATGGATSLLEPEQLVDSLPGSNTTSRAVSPIDEDEVKSTADVDADADGDADADADADEEDDLEAKPATQEEEEQEPLDTAAGTPVPDILENDEDTTTDEAAIRRQEAMEELTKIEIGFAMLRDRLYVERLEEISREGDMIFDGTHPELLHLTKAIDVRRQRRTQLVELYFEEQQHQYERVAKAEEFSAWSIWRSSCAGLRRDMMDDLSRKRRRLDREKRTLDAPRPVRRHQVFETELVRNLDRVHIPLYHDDDPSRKRRAAAKRRAEAQLENEAANEFVAYPDLKGLTENDVMMDIDQMGIRPAGVPPGMYDPYYAQQMGLEFPGPEFYAMYGPDAAAAAAAHAHMNGMPFGFNDGGRGPPPMPPPPGRGGMMAPGTPGSSHTPIRHGGHHPPPPGMDMGMMGYDPYAAAEMEHAARMHHREQAARMGFDPNDPHYRGSPFPPDMYGYPYGGEGPPPMEGGGSRGLPGLPSSPPPSQRASNTGGRIDRIAAEDSAGSSRPRSSDLNKTPSRPKQVPRPPQSSGPPPPGGVNPNLPRPPSSFGEPSSADGREVKQSSQPAPTTSNGTATSAPHAAPIPAKPQPPPPSAPKYTADSGPETKQAPLAATPVAVAAASGIANTRLYPPVDSSPS